MRGAHRVVAETPSASAPASLFCWSAAEEALSAEQSAQRARDRRRVAGAGRHAARGTATPAASSSGFASASVSQPPGATGATA